MVEELEKKKIAENERLKGNECVKSKDYREAVVAYTRSIELNEGEPFTYANRAMAHLKLKDYKSCIEDASTALKFKPGYLKAYHRRGLAYKALNKHEQAIKDFQFILEEEPENRGVNKDLKETRKALNDSLSKEPMIQEVPDEAPKETAKLAQPDANPEKKKFVRVAIEEDSSDEETPLI